MAVSMVDRNGEPALDSVAVRYGATEKDREEAADESRFVELIDGRLVVHSSAGWEHRRLLGFLHHLIRDFVEQRDLGEVLTGPFTMDLELLRRFEPDIVYASKKSLGN